MVTLTHGAHRALPDYHSPKTKPTCMYMFARVVHTAHEFSLIPRTHQTGNHQPHQRMAEGIGNGLES